MKNILILANEHLIAVGSAGTTVMCGLVEAALGQGWHVTYIALVKKTVMKTAFESNLYSFGDADQYLIRQEWLYTNKKVGRWKSFIGVFDSSCVTQMEAPPPYGLSSHYDRVIAFESLAIHAASEVSSSVHIAIIGDPAGRRLWHTASWKSPILKLKALALDIAELIYFGWKIPKHWMLAMFGTKHSRIWGKMLLRPVIDLRPFMPKNAKVKLDKNMLKQLPTFAFGGTLAGTASRLGLAVIKTDYLPALRNRFGRNNFEFRLVGECTDDIASAIQFEFPELRILGKVPSFEKELAKSNVFILMMNYPVGVRTRICSALAAGNICIVHSSVLENMPELRYCSAVMIANSVSDFIHHIDDIPSGDELLVLQKNAQSFFDKFYAATNSSKPILRALLSTSKSNHKQHIYD
jgi:hypothetical protein